VGVAITKNHAVIFIDKVREGGGYSIDAATHHLDGNRFCLEGEFVVNGCDALGIVQSHWSNESVHLQALDPLVNGLLAGSEQAHGDIFLSCLSGLGLYHVPEVVRREENLVGEILDGRKAFGPGLARGDIFIN